MKMHNDNKRLKEQLARQIHFISKSCQAYDEGFEPEAIRIAQSLRVLFNDTNNSTSLMKHMGRTNQIVLSSTLGDYPAGPLTAFINIEINAAVSRPIRARPRLGNDLVPLPFRDWWAETVHFRDGRNYARSQLVRTAADKDGGAHVDMNLDPLYEDLEAGASFLSFDGGNLQYDGPAPYDQSQTHFARDLHLAILRQLGHEVRLSAMRFKWIL